jgi:hypothetical protein
MGNRGTVYALHSEYSGVNFATAEFPANGGLRERQKLLRRWRCRRDPEGFDDASAVRDREAYRHLATRGVLAGMQPEARAALGALTRCSAIADDRSRMS